MVVDLSPWAVKCINKKRRTFLRKGSDEVKGGHCMLAWPKVCRPPELVGLGFLDLQLFGYALRMRWLWLKRTDDSGPVWFCSALVNSDTLTVYYGVKQSQFTKPTPEPPH